MPQNKFYNKVSDQIRVTRLAVEQQCRCFVESGKGNTEGGRRLQDSRRQWHLYLFRWMCVTNSTAQTSTLHFIDLHQRGQWTNNTHFFGALFLNLQPYKVANLTENTRQIAPSLRRWKVANIFCKQGRNQTWSNSTPNGFGNLCTGLRETWFAQFHSAFPTSFQWQVATMKPSGWSTNGLTPPAFSSTGLRGANICNKFRRFSAWSASSWHVDASASFYSRLLEQSCGTCPTRHELCQCLLVTNTCRNSRIQIKTIIKCIRSSLQQR